MASLRAALVACALVLPALFSALVYEWFGWTRLFLQALLVALIGGTVGIALRQRHLLPRRLVDRIGVAALAGSTLLVAGVGSWGGLELGHSLAVLAGFTALGGLDHTIGIPAGAALLAVGWLRRGLVIRPGRRVVACSLLIWVAWVGGHALEELGAGWVGFLPLLGGLVVVWTPLFHGLPRGVVALAPPAMAVCCGLVAGKVGEGLVAGLPVPVPRGLLPVVVALSFWWLGHRWLHGRRCGRGGRALEILAIALLPTTFLQEMLWTALARPVGIAVALVALAHLPALLWPARVHPLAPVYALWPLSFVWFVLVRSAPSTSSCASLGPLWSLEAVAYEGAEPYDLRLDGDQLLVSYRRLGQAGGFVELVPLADPGAARRLELEPSAGNTWVESLYRSPRPGRWVAAVVGAGDFSLRELEVTEEALRWVREVPLEREPTHGAVSADGRILVQPLMSGAADRGDLPERGLLVFVDLARMLVVDEVGWAGDGYSLAEWATWAPSGAVWVPMLHEFLRLVFLRIEDGEVVGGWESFRFAVGVQSDGERLYAGNMVGGTLDTWDLASQSLVDSVPVGADPGVLVLDGRDLWLASYAEGSVSRFTLDAPGRAGLPTLSERWRVGPLVRGLEIAEGRAFATSVCGVFELVEAGS